MISSGQGNDLKLYFSRTPYPPFIYCSAREGGKKGGRKNQMVYLLADVLTGRKRKGGMFLILTKEDKGFSDFVWVKGGNGGKKKGGEGGGGVCDGCNDLSKWPC